MPLPAYTIDPAFMARHAERLGFESIWYAEHPAVPVESASPFPSTGGAIPWTYSHFTDPYIALARASAVTTKLKLGTGITLVPQRNPLLLAKEVAALDLHSGGRFIFGIGTGWLKEEVEMFGGNFPRRWTQTREALDVMKALWTRTRPSFTANFSISRRCVRIRSRRKSRIRPSSSGDRRRTCSSASSITRTAGCPTA